MKKRKIFSNLWFAIFLASNASFLSASLYAQTNVDPPQPQNVDAQTNIEVVPPTNTFYGTRGLSQTASAEALGEGRLIFGFNGSWYQQKWGFIGSPNKDANIFTGIGAASFGVSPYIDLFASVTGFGSMDYTTGKGSGLGTFGGGLQGTLPFEPNAPIRMGAQFGIHRGISDNAINTNRSDGYNYFETRKGLDFMGKLVQTLAFGDENLAFKIHFNEGLVTSMQENREALLLLGLGAQMNLFFTVLGMELHSRTDIEDIAFQTDPLWVTPSLQFRTDYNLNVILGGNISLSQDRETNRSLEPFRLFAGLAFTFDTQADQRRAAKEKARYDAMEKYQLRSTNISLADSIVKKNQEDSLTRIQEKQKSDSLKTAIIQKTYQDSLALEQARKSLEEEKSKRTDAEKQLLSTGLLLLDAVYFETGKTVISINSLPYLNIIAKMLTKYPKLRIEVAGHTDNVGTDLSNDRLSQGRAESVKNYMIQVSPELAQMLTAKGYGETRPKADNKTANGRKLNRRTELAVLNTEMLKEYHP